MEQPEFERLAIEDDEEDLIIPGDAQTEEGVDLSLCLVGRFLTDRSIRVQMMKERMAEVWRPMRGVSIREVDQGIFLFQFFHKLDIQRVLKVGPWSFDKHLLILSIIREGEVPGHIPLYTIPFWLQIHNVPTCFMSFAVGQNIANFLGEFLEYDEKNNSNLWRKYMRVRVLVDVRKPLKRMKKIKKAGGEAKNVTFKYEKLGPFCYLCGVLGHIEDYYEKLFAMDSDDDTQCWRPELRVDPRNIAGTGGSCWLRKGGKKLGTFPLQNEATNHGNIINSAANPNYETPVNVEAQKKNNMMATIFKNPDILFSRESTSTHQSGDFPKNNGKNMDAERMET